MKIKTFFQTICLFLAALLMVADEYVRETIIEYFKEADTPDVDVAYQELEEITWGEIQLMRLKFLID